MSLFVRIIDGKVIEGVAREPTPGPDLAPAHNHPYIYRSERDTWFPIGQLDPEPHLGHPPCVAAIDPEREAKAALIRAAIKKQTAITRKLERNLLALYKVTYAQPA